MTYESTTRKLTINSGDGKTTTDKFHLKNEVQIVEQETKIELAEPFTATTQGTLIHESLKTQNDGDGVVDIGTAVAAAAAAALATTDVVHLDVVDPAAIVAATASNFIEVNNVDIGINLSPTIGNATTTSTNTCTVNDSITVKNEINMISQQPTVVFSDSTAMIPASLTSHSITTDLLQDMTLPNAITDAVFAATNAVDVGAASVAAMAAATAAALATTATSADQDTSDLIAQATAAAFEAVSADDDGGVISIDAATLAAATSAAFAAVDQAATDEAIAAVAASFSLDHDTLPTMHPTLPLLLPVGTNGNKRKPEDKKEIKQKRVRRQKTADEKADNASKPHALAIKTKTHQFPSGDVSVSVSDAGSTATKRSRSSMNSFNSENDGSEQHGQLSSRRMKDRERYAKMTPEQRQLYNRKRREQYHRQTELSRQKRRERERNRYHALPQEMTHERNSRRAKLERDRYQKLNAEQLAVKNKARRERAALARKKKLRSHGTDDSAELDSVSIIGSTKPAALQSDEDLVRNVVPDTEENKMNIVNDENHFITLKNGTSKETVAKV